LYIVIIIPINVSSRLFGLIQ